MTGFDLTDAVDTAHHRIRWASAARVGQTSAASLQFVGEATSASWAGDGTAIRKNGFGNVGSTVVNRRTVNCWIRIHLAVG